MMSLSIVHFSFCLPLLIMHVDVMRQRIYDLHSTSYVLAFDELMRCLRVIVLLL